MEMLNSNPRYRRSDFENYSSSNNNNNNPFLMEDDSNDNRNDTSERAVPFRRFSLQQSFTETENGSESIKRSYKRIQMEGMYAAGEGSTNNCTVVHLDSLGLEDLRQVAVKLADERDQLLHEINAVTKHNHLLRRQIHRSSLNQRWSCGREVTHNKVNEKSISTLVSYSSCEDTSVVNENDDLFLLPEDLKETPNKISVMLSQSMTVLAQINNQDVIEKVCAGGHIAKQMVVGNVVGYCTAHVVRKFGKLAAGSIIGSFCVIKLAHHRGYISVDWKRIQKQIESPQQPGTDTTDGDKCDDIAWITKKIQQIREWSKENTFTVVGFCAGFAINSLNL